MTYCVIIHISRSQISFYYQQKGGKITVLEFNGEQEHPLYFYLHNNDFSFGNYAKQQFLNGDPNAYGNYFETITQPSKSFNFYGTEKPIKYLLYHAIENVLNHFFNTVLYESNSIESYRTDFPLRFAFDADIQEKEKRLVEVLFSEAGFRNFETLSINKFFFEELFDNNNITKQDNVIKLESINGFLFALFFQNDFSNPLYSKSFIDLGADPRTRITAELIFNSAIAITRSSLNKEDEISHLIPYAKQFLISGSAQPRGIITLSDGSKPFVSIKMREVIERLTYLGFDTKLYNAIDNFITEYNISKNKTLKFVLVGEEMNSSYFTEKLTNKYQNIIATKPLTIYNSIERAAKYVESNGYSISQKLEENKNLGIPPLPEYKKSEKPPLPDFKKITPPPLPENKKPPLPPFKNGTTNINGNQNKSEQLIGMTGVAITDLKLSGKIEVQGSLYEAVAESTNIMKGKKIKIIDFNNSIFSVKEIFQSPPLPPPLPPNKKKT